MKSWGALHIMEGFLIPFVEVIKCEEMVNLVCHACLALIYGLKENIYIQLQSLLVPMFNQFFKSFKAAQRRVVIKYSEKSFRNP